MILAIDVGNSDIIFGVIEKGEIRRIMRIHTEANYTAEEYGIKLHSLMDYCGINPKKFEGAILSSVVPPVTGAMKTAVQTLTGRECLLVGPGMKTGLNVRIDDPTSLAGELVVGSVAAITNYGMPAIVLDMETATTISVIDGKGCYRGGAIIPGVKLGLQALSAGTSLLPEISLTAPKKVIATNTVDAMRSGAIYATASMIDGMIERMEEELGSDCSVIATGSYARAVMPFCKKEILYDEDLLLKGLWTLWEKNRKPEKTAQGET